MTDKAKLYAVKNDEGKYAFCEIGEPHWEVGFGTLWSEVNKPYAERTAKDIGGHVVELVEAQAKVVVSEEEAEMLKKAKDTTVWRPAAVISEYAYNAAKDSDQEALLEDRLMRAYVIGWTVEKPKRWNVKVPHATNSYYYDMGWGNGLETQDMKAGTQPLPGFREAQFTQDEINKRGLQDCKRVDVTDDEQ